MYITATAPHPLVVEFIAEATGAAITLAWTTWRRPSRCRGGDGPDAFGNLPDGATGDRADPPARSVADERLQEPGPVKRDEKVVLAVFGLPLLPWAGGPAMVLAAAGARPRHGRRVPLVRAGPGVRHEAQVAGHARVRHGAAPHALARDAAGPDT
jgi:hypothetical protein